MKSIDDLETGELLPCPFCGGKAKQIDFEDEEVEPDNIGGSCISCTRCHVSTAVVFGFKETLYSSWNPRSDLRRRLANNMTRTSEHDDVVERPS